MQTASDIKNSIKAIQEISQITNAMKLISTSKMTKAIQRYEANLLYFERVQSVLKDLLATTEELHHVYFTPNNEGVPAYVVIAADKGLCGGYNHNVLNFAYRQMQPGDKMIITIGQETRAFFERKNIMIDLEYLHIVQQPTLYEARNLTNDICRMYREKLISEATLIYTRYYSRVKQAPVAMKLLPVSESTFAGEDLGSTYSGDFSYHPSRREVFDTLVPQYILGLVYGALVQAAASENAARLMAMDSAAKNADEMIRGLSMQLNHARQQAVTREITEIVSAVEALAED
ncbi:MAG: ATP synthase F1 subunit gamma [Clostridia bacterium]|nr:ATP synthase F1 subunit gamma [Clostridia bacterium]